MSDVVKVSWSGGKDSTCALSMHLDRGDVVKAVCYVPMFNDDIPLIFKEHYDFIQNAADAFRRRGAQIWIVSGLTYFDYFYKIVQHGKNKGLIYGFPCFVGCAFKTHSKIPAINKCNVGNFDYADIGIAYDEKDRKKQLTSNMRSILVENQITEQMARDYCAERGILSPHYDRNTRDGCALCPNAKQAERERFFREYPQAVEIVKQMQADQREMTKQRIYQTQKARYHTPLRNGQWFIEETVTFWGIENKFN